VLGKTKPKVYYGVLEDLRNYIRENHLSPGDKLPSERELAERLGRGRSSVREALRALELLGLIETRHGEGTYLRSYQSLQSVELLSSFILLEGGTRKELLQTKWIIEKEITKLAFQYLDDNSTTELQLLLEQEENSEEKHALFYNYLLAKTNNQLLLKIWTLMEEFSRSIYQPYYKAAFYEGLVEIFSKRDFSAIEAWYESQRPPLIKE